MRSPEWTPCCAEQRKGESDGNEGSGSPLGDCACFGAPHPPHPIPGTRGEDTEKGEGGWGYSTGGSTVWGQHRPTPPLSPLLMRLLAFVRKERGRNKGQVQSSEAQRRARCSLAWPTHPTCQHTCFGTPSPATLWSGQQSSAHTPQPPLADSETSISQGTLPQARNGDAIGTPAEKM